VFGYVIMGGLMIAGGLIGFLFIRPEADRKRLALHITTAPAMRTASAV
jgi:hypothetical protein